MTVYFFSLPSPTPSLTPFPTCICTPFSPHRTLPAYGSYTVKYYFPLFICPDLPSTRCPMILFSPNNIAICVSSMIYDLPCIMIPLNYFQAIYRCHTLKFAEHGMILRPSTQALSQHSTGYLICKC